jgi:exopolysaccharide/PEP-CTERM locus tyrosine autokinase
VQDLTNQFRRLKWPVLDAAFGRSTASLERGNLVMVGSAMPNEGKTFTVLNLALNISLERDCSVVLVDADVTKSHVSRLLGVQNERGLIDLLQDGQGMLSDAMIDTDIDGLGIVPAGRASAHAPELLASRRMEELLVGESSRYPDRIFLFDSSPVLATNEAQVLARLVGQVLLVVRAAQTAQSAVQDALALLQGSRSIACVLNDVQGGLGSEYYSYEYYGHERAEPGT